MQRILFVCLGNICRSPAAEAVFAARARDAGLRVATDSAGTSGWHVGEPPYGPMIAAAARRGYDLSALRARQVSADDFAAFDLVLAMDRSNLADLAALRPAASSAELALFLGQGEVPDPWYSRDFDAALDLIEEGADRLLARLGATGA
jgi:protein-tyrosine phosphatase